MKIRISYRSGDGLLALLMLIGSIVLLIAAIVFLFMFFEYINPGYTG